MGCSDGRTVEGKPKENHGFPVCKFTIPLTKPTDAIKAVSDDQILLGAKDEIEILEISTKNITAYSKEHVGRINSFVKMTSGNIATAGQDKSIKVWDLSKKESLMTFTGHKSMIWTMTEIQGNKLMTGGSDKIVKIWDVNTQKEEGEFYKGNNEISVSLQLKSGKIVLCCGTKLILFDYDTKKEEKNLDIPSGVWAITQLKNGDILAGLGNGNLAVIDEKELTIKKTLDNGHKRSCTCVIELDNSKVVSACDTENDLILWDLTDPTKKYVIQGHTAPVLALTFISGRKFASTSEDKTLKIWE